MRPRTLIAAALLLPLLALAQTAERNTRHALDLVLAAWLFSTTNVTLSVRRPTAPLRRVSHHRGSATHVGSDGADVR